MTRTYIEKPEAGPGTTTSLTIEPAMALLAPAIAPHCVLAEVGKHGAAAASYRSQTIGATGQLPERDFRVECLEYSGAPTPRRRGDGRQYRHRDHQHRSHKHAALNSLRY
jgi:hypothetical protein